MRQLLIVAACSVAVMSASPSARSQSSTAPTSPQATFRSGVSLITIDVSVFDKDGKPVPGLTADDIEIKLNGKAQPIRALVFVDAAKTVAAEASPAASRVTMPAPPPAAATAVPDDNAPRRTISNLTAGAAAPLSPAPAPPAAVAPRPASPAESRVFILLVDDLSFPATRGKAMFAAAQRFLDRVPAADLIGFTTTSGVGAVNPTRDRAALRAALAKVVGAFNDPRGIGKSGPVGDGGIGGTKGSPDSSLGINESIDIERGDESLLKEVIARECFNGDRTEVNSRSLAQILIEDNCAAELQREARRVAALSRQNKGRQIDGILSVINAMKAADGIRHLVLLTEGLPVSREVNDLNPLAKAAAQAGVQLSVLFETADASMTDEGRRAVPTDTSPQTDPGSSRRRREDDMLFLNGAQTLSDMLGGTFYRVVGSPDPSFSRVIVASAAVYRLGVELPSGTAPGKEFAVSASVKRPGLTARANRLAVSAAPIDRPAAASPATATEPTLITGPVLASLDDVLKAALNANTSSTHVPIRMAATVRRSANVANQVDISVNIVIPASVKGPITTFVGVVDEANALKVSRRVLEPAVGRDYTLPVLFPVPSGRYRVRLAAADSTGVLGTIELPVNATLTPMAAFTSSDVLTWYVDATNKAQLFAIDDVPDGIDTLHGSLELYPTGAMPAEYPEVRWTLTREGAPTPVVDERTSARPSATMLRSDVELAWAALPAGEYILRASLMANDVVVGTKAAVVRKR